MTAHHWAIYARVSSQEQAGPDTASIEAQLKEAGKLVEQGGGLLVSRYVDDHRYRVNGKLVEPSGERADRPEWQKLLADLRSGAVNAVAAYHSGRLYRAYRPFVDFIEIVEANDIHVQLARDTWNRQFAVFQAWRDREENRTRVDRTLMGRRKAARLGLPATSVPRFYRVTRDEQGKRTGYELREEYRAFLDDLARLFLERRSYESIARDLARNPVTGKPLLPASVRSFIANEFLRGTIAYGHQARKEQAFEQPGRHTPAWDAETCTAIEAELARRAAVGALIPHGQKRLLAGILRCGYCGRIMPGYALPPSGRVYYSCHAAYKHLVEHPGNNISERKALSEIQDFYRQLTNEQLAASDAQERPQPDRAAERANLSSQIKELEQALKAAPPTARYVRSHLSAELDSLQKALARVDLRRAEASAPAVPSAERLAAIQVLKETDDWGVFEPEKLRGILLEAVPTLYIQGGVIVLPPA